MDFTKVENPNAWLPLNDFEEMPLLQDLGWTKNAMIGAHRMGLLLLKWDTKMSCWTTTLNNIKAAIVLYNMAMELRKVDAKRLDELLAEARRRL